MIRPLRLAPALVIGLLPFAGHADDAGHCPAETAANSFPVSDSGAKIEAEKKKIGGLASGIAAARSPVCILALVDTKNPAYSKKLAIRRIIWVKKTLMEDGVGPELIAAELRPAPEGTDEETLQAVKIILGK